MARGRRKKNKQKKNNSASDAKTLPPADTLLLQRVEVFIGVASLNGDHYTDRKSTVFPFIARCFGSEVDRGPRRPTGAHFYRE